MFNLPALIRQLLTEKQEGAALVEYALLVGLIAVACIVVTQLLGLEVSSVFSYLQTTLQGLV